MIIDVSHKYKNFIFNSVHIRNAMWVKEVANISKGRINDISIDTLRKIEPDNIITKAVTDKTKSLTTVANNGYIKRRVETGYFTRMVFLM